MLEALSPSQTSQAPGAPEELDEFLDRLGTLRRLDPKVLEPLGIAAEAASSLTEE